jgi:O-antigen ligase
MPIAGIALLVIGAILVFAVTGSVSGIDLHAVGTIFMVAGAALLLFPLVVRGRPRPKRWSARSRQDAIDEADARQAQQRMPDDHEK